MSEAHGTEVVILGAGCSGLFLAEALAGHGIPCAFIDKDPVGKYASTRNQGWLQVGSFNACTGLPRIRTCREGFDYITQNYPTAVHRSMDSHFLFRFGDQLDEALRRCDEADVETAVLQREDLEDLIEENPILQDCEFSYAIRTQDCSIDTTSLLREVVCKALGSGAQYHAVPSIEKVHFMREASGWRVVLPGGDDIWCRAVVLACGPCIPNILRDLFPGQKTWSPRLYKVALLVFRDRRKLATSAMFAPQEKSSPCIVPFDAYEDEQAGLTAYLRRDMVTDTNDYAIPNDTLDRFEKALGALYPGIHILARAIPVPALFYICHRLETSTGFTYEEELDTHGRVLVRLYALKFTHSPILARKFARSLAEQLHLPWVEGSASSSPSSSPSVANQPYFGQLEYRLESDGKTLSFEENKI